VEAWKITTKPAKGEHRVTSVDVRKRKKVFSPFVLELLFIMFAVEFVKGALLLAILPVYMATVLGASAYVIGWTLAAQYIGDNALRTPAGWIIDKIGYRACMLSGVLLAFVAVVIVAATTHYAWTIVACAMLGLGTAPLWPCVITGATEEAGDEAQGTVMGIVHMAWLSGAGLGPAAINFFVRNSNYSVAFRLMLGCMTAAVLAALLLPERRKMKEKAPNNALTRAAASAGASSVFFAGGLIGRAFRAERAAGPRRDSRRWLQRARAYIREVRSSLALSPLLFPAMFLQAFALGLLTPVLTLYARQELSLTPQQYSVFLITGGAVTVLFLIPVGKLVDRFGTRPFLTAGFALGAATLLAFTYTRSLYVLYGFVSSLGIAFAFIIPAWNALIAAAIPKEKRGAVWGVFLTIEGLGTIAGPVVSGKLWDVYGPHAPFMASGAALALLLVMQLQLARHKPKARAGA
jgi:DHA1 family multidrug resistance protein-like MFS transporter